MGLCAQLREDGHLTAGACGFTSWNETVGSLSEAHVNRESRHIMAVSNMEEEDESEEEGPPAQEKNKRTCRAAPQG